MLCVGFGGKCVGEVALSTWWKVGMASLAAENVER